MLRNIKTKPCHNCRRRRLRCDRSWPTCNKCALSGQECLGYGKVFVWAQAIGTTEGNPRPGPVSRGSSADPNSFQIRGPAGLDFGRSQEGNAALGWPVGVWDDGHRHADLPQPTAHQITPFEQERNAPVRHQIDTCASAASALIAGKPSNTAMTDSHHDKHHAANSLRPQHVLTAGASLLLKIPTDPVLQDLDQTSRCYLSHFARSVCKDLEPGGEPFIQLIPLTHQYPLLREIIVATSALHFSNVSRSVDTFASGLGDSGSESLRRRTMNLVSKRALIDALTAKQKALVHLRKGLDTLDSAGGEVVLAALHFFIKFDLIDLDRPNGKGWQAHLEGASSVVSLMTSQSSKVASTDILRDCLITHCFIYHVLGSTLASGAIASRMARQAIGLIQVVKRVEANSLLSCPTQILQIILDATMLSYGNPHSEWNVLSAERALDLIDQSLAFDILAWADELGGLHVPDIESRMHVASAHRSAVCLYILQVLPTVRAVRPLDKNVLVDDILSHLAQINKTDPYIKATAWPTFIAGAETRDTAKRDWAMTRLFDVWRACPWGYIVTAIEMLKATWKMQDSNMGSGTNWLQELKDMGFDHLIV